jgi:AcrR family transcriptional regulator
MRSMGDATTDAVAETPPASDTPPRPLRADARRNRERVLRAAQELFTADGLSVPLDEVARRAGVGAGTVHRHFPTKEALLAAIVVDRVEQLVATGRALAGSADPGAALLRLLALMLDEGAVSHPLKAALVGTDFDLRTAAPGAAEDLHAAVAALLAEAQRASQVRRDLDADDVMALLAGVFGMYQHASADAERAARLRAVLFDGLRTVR